MSWERFSTYYREFAELDFAIDISRMDFGDSFWSDLEPALQSAYADMLALEKGAIANPDEGRMVGHYWLRNPALAPTAELTEEIAQTLAKVKAFTQKVHAGEIKGATGAFRNVLVIGIGGSALGPQFVSQALGHPKTDKMAVFFFDNTDPDGMARTLAELEGRLGETICLVISKSGGTPETRNGMLEAKAAYDKVGLDFASHAVAITGEGSKLDQVAVAEKWVERFPMWDWVGGRTSEMATVGLVPAALQGLDIQGMLDGAKAMDDVTRSSETHANPAALLAGMWYYATGGKGEKDMVILPYKDRLQLFSKYLQQLVMESLGKELDLDGKRVNQGIAVYGNKGSTDQHAYVQQLREGVNNFFATFIEVLSDGESQLVEVEENTTSGDFLQGFFLGTRAALHENGRESITLTIQEVTPQAVGMLIALFERAVGLYASLVNINAYHQPGVEAGKKAAASVLELKMKVWKTLQENAGSSFTAAGLTQKIGLESGQAEAVFKLLKNLAANPAKKIVEERGENALNNQYSFKV